MTRKGPRIGDTTPTEDMRTAARAMLNDTPITDRDGSRFRNAAMLGYLSATIDHITTDYQGDDESVTLSIARARAYLDEYSHDLSGGQ